MRDAGCKAGSIFDAPRPYSGRHDVKAEGGSRRRIGIRRRGDGTGGGREPKEIPVSWERRFGGDAE